MWRQNDSDSNIQVQSSELKWYMVFKEMISNWKSNNQIVLNGAVASALEALFDFCVFFKSIGLRIQNLEYHRGATQFYRIPKDGVI